MAANINKPSREVPLEDSIPTPYTIHTLITYFGNNIEAIDFIKQMKATLTPNLHTYDIALALSECTNQLTEQLPKETLMTRTCDYLADHVCTPEIRRTYTWRKHSERLLDLYKQYMEMEFLALNTAVKELYDTLTNQDRQLAMHWDSAAERLLSIQHWEVRDGSHKVLSPAQFGRLLSARAAEKHVKQFYEQLGHTVQDIALTQLTDPQNSDWKTHDLELEDGKSLDVKNARTPINNSSLYVEHTVRKFKHNTMSRDVTLVGVISPYIPMDGHYEFIHSFRSSRDVTTVLGETTYTEIALLKRYFGHEALTLKLATRYRIPPWLYEYPQEFYEKRADLIDELRKVTADVEMPTLQEFHSLGINPLPLLLVTKQPLPNYWKAQLPNWLSDLFDQLQAAFASLSFSLPVLYLALLRHFIDTVRHESPQNYDPRRYLELLYWTNEDSDIDDLKQKLESERVHRLELRPLGMRDPLNIVVKLCHVLYQVWKNRKTIRLERFDRYRFHGLGLLQGHCTDSSPDLWVTIWAYCGGFIEYKRKRGKCGRAPLILGNQDLCPYCHKLICDAPLDPLNPKAGKCGYCDDVCRGPFRDYPAREYTDADIPCEVEESLSF